MGAENLNPMYIGYEEVERLWLNEAGNWFFECFSIQEAVSKPLHEYLEDGKVETVAAKVTQTRRNTKIADR